MVLTAHEILCAYYISMTFVTKQMIVKVNRFILQNQGVHVVRHLLLASDNAIA